MRTSGVYVPEIAPLSVRHVGTAMGVFTQRFVTFIVLKFGPMGISASSWKFYLLFRVFNVLTVVFIYFFVKETKGQSLEETDVLHPMEAQVRPEAANPERRPPNARRGEIEGDELMDD